MRRPIEGPIRRVDQIEGSAIARGRKRPKKTIGENIKRDLKLIV